MNDDDLPRCSFCNIRAEDLPENGVLIRGPKTDAHICASCLRTAYDLLQGGGEPVEDSDDVPSAVNGRGNTPPNPVE